MIAKLIDPEFDDYMYINVFFLFDVQFEKSLSNTSIRLFNHLCEKIISLWENHILYTYKFIMIFFDQLSMTTMMLLLL